ncbi:MAG: ABC transporter permease [bacterium]|nr:ABC transporter permease [bacterium]
MNHLRIKGIIAQNLFHLRHSLEDLIDTFFWPLIDVIIWGFMTTYFVGLGGPVAGLITFLMGGLILWNIVWRAQQDVSLTLLRNVWSRNIFNLFISPLTPKEFIVATMILGFLKILLTLSLISTIAFFLYSFNLLSLGFYLLPFFVALIAFAWAVGVFITGLIIRFGMRIQAFAWSLIVLLHPVSAVFYPVSILPPFLQKIAWFLPTAHIFEGMREVLSGGELSIEHLIWAFGLNIIYLAFSAWFFAFMFEKAREKGKLAKVET